MNEKNNTFLCSWCSARLCKCYQFNYFYSQSELLEQMITTCFGHCFRVLLMDTNFLIDNNYYQNIEFLSRYCRLKKRKSKTRSHNFLERFQVSRIINETLNNAQRGLARGKSNLSLYSCSFFFEHGFFPFWFSNSKSVGNQSRNQCLHVIHYILSSGYYL